MMKERRKQIFAAVISVFIIATLLPSPAFAAGEDTAVPVTKVMEERMEDEVGVAAGTGEECQTDVFEAAEKTGKMLLDDTAEPDAETPEEFPDSVMMPAAAETTEPAKIENPRIQKVHEDGIEYVWDEFTPPEGEQVRLFNLSGTWQGKYVLNSDSRYYGSSLSIKAEIYKFFERVDVVPGKSYTIDLLLKAKNPAGKVIGISDPFTVTISVSDVEETLNDLTLPDKLRLGEGCTRYLAADVVYQWSADGSDMVEYIEYTKAVGEVLSVKSSDPSVISVKLWDGQAEIDTLKVGASEITLKYTYKGKTTTIIKTIKVLDQYLAFMYEDYQDPYYGGIPAGTSKSLYIRSSLYKRSGSSEYVYAGDVTDTTVFTVEDIIYNEVGSGEPLDVTDKVDVSFEGNVLTITTDGDIPDGNIRIYYSGISGKTEEYFQGYTGFFVRQKLHAFRSVGTFLLPLPGKSAQLDLVLESYDRGTVIDEEPAYIKLAGSGGVRITCADGQELASGESFTMDRLPLTIENLCADMFFDEDALPWIRFEAYDENDVMLDQLDYCLESEFPCSVLKVKSSMVYTGKPLKPVPTLTYGDTRLDLSKYEVKYYNNTNIGTATVRIDIDSDWLDITSKVATFRILPQAPVISKILPPATGKGLVVSWEKVPGVSGYRVYRDGKAVATVRGASNITWTDLDAKVNGTRYSYRVRAYKTVSGKNYWSSYSAGRSYVALTRTTNLVLTNPSAKTMKATWKKNVKADGYQIQYAEKSNFAGKTTVRITNATTISKTIKPLIKGKTYYARVRAYKGGCHSAWSAVKKLKITK